MTVILVILAALGCACCFTAGLGSDARLTAVTVAAWRVRYACSAGELLTGVAVLFAAAGTCALGGAAGLTARASRVVGETADRAACRTITGT